jgi:crotonobetaine/carnitine-CoA ligase
MSEEQALQYFTDLIEHRGNTLGEKPCIIHEDQVVSFAEFDRATCRAANGLTAQGGQPGDGLAILMANCVEYLYLFVGLPRAGFYTVPVNTALKGDGLAYILDNSDVRFLVVDEDLYPRFEEIRDRVGGVERVFVRRSSSTDLPSGTRDLADLLDASPEKPDYEIVDGAITYLMYTSGTTGFPKGVVNRQRGGVEGLIGLASLLYQDGDVLYTALPLFHANALVLTAAFAMGAGVPFALDKKFSASGFWDSTRRYGATAFNALGAMVPILMKQPEKPDDADNPVRVVLTSACPANLWETFQTRFGVNIIEGYGAVDGGGVLTLNFGDAPVGSLGKPVTGNEWRLVDDEGGDVPQGEIGELITKVADRETGSVEYYKNPDATSDKVRGDWIYTGDLMYADEDGNLFFVDRKTDSMRRRGENISSFEVENMIEKHPDVAECAAFGVPSELGEHDVMIWVKPKPGADLDLGDLIGHCSETMARFMIPRYIDVVEDIPRTGTLRVQKADLKKRGVTDRTWDREKEMPEL